MPASPATALLMFVACAILVSGTWSWLIAAAKAALTWRWLSQPLAGHVENALKTVALSPRLPLVPWTPRRPAPWALIDLIGLVGVWLCASLAVSAMARGLGWIEAASDVETLSLDQRKAVIVGNMAISLFIAGVGLTIIALRTGATLRDLGWSWRDLLSDLRLGLIGFVMLAPPTYALQGVLVSIWKPSKHPLMEMFKGTPDASFFALLFFSAAIVAPLFEELMFRVLLQGFLEKALSFWGDFNELFIGSLPAVSSEVPAAASSLAEPTADGANSGMAAEIQQSELREAPAWLPIAISSGVFALLHYSHGPDWIPLLLLAAGMGYLYQRTHRLLPSLVVHSLLNSLSMWGLWVQVHETSF